MPRNRVVGAVAPWLGTGLASVAVISSGALLWSSPAKADVGSFYSASASSVVVDGYFSNPSIPVGVRPEGGGPQTDVAQSSLDKGDADASFPYFGPYVATAPGLVGGLFGFPVPPYPLTASSTFGGAPARVDFPGIELSATSLATSTTAEAVFGSAGSGGVSHSEVDESADGNVTAFATAASPLTVLGPLASIKGFDSAVSVTADRAGVLTRTSNFTIDEIAVPGLVLRIPERSPSSFPVPFPVPVPGVPAPDPIPAPSFPVPNGGATLVEPRIGFSNGFFVVSQPFAGKTEKYVVPADAVVNAFSAQGVTLRYTAPQQTKDGILGGVFSLEYDMPAPPDNSLYKGPTPATFIIGDTRAAVTRAPETAGGPGVGAAAVVGPALPGGTAPVAVAPARPLPTADLTGAATQPANPDGVPTVNFQPQASEGPSGSPDGLSAALVAAGLPTSASADFSAMYLALIGLTVVGLFAAAVVGAKGVSARWTS